MRKCPAVDRLAKAGSLTHDLEQLPKKFSAMGSLLTPLPPLKKGGNYKNLLLKSPFGQEDLRTSIRKDFVANAISIKIIR